MDVASLQPERYMGLCISIANKMKVPPGVERDDLVGAAMLALVREGPKFDPSRGVPEKRWVGALVERRMVDEIRHEAGRGPNARMVKTLISMDAEMCKHGSDDDHEWVVALPDPSPSVVDVLIAGEDQRLARRLMGILPERERTIIVMGFFDGMSTAEIGRRFGFDRSRASQIKHQALRRMRAAA